MPKLTKRTVDTIEPQPTEFFIWDESIPGFGLRVMPSGRKSFVVQYRAGRRPRRMSLGPSTVLTCDQARTRAITIIAAVKNGEDPAADRAAKRNAATVSDLAERFDKEHIAVRLKASTAKEYRGNLRRFILPALGRLAVPEITRADVAKFHHDLRHIPYQANRCLEVVSKMFVLEEMWGLRPDGSNPRKHIRKYPEEKRERFLSAAELRRIGEVLREMESERVELSSAILAAREVTAERIRDKIAASKKKGLWMGGLAPIGYDPHPDTNRRELVINPGEARIVTQLFELYLEHGCLNATAKAAGQLGLHSKHRVFANGREQGGSAFSRGQIYKILTNPVYRGRIRHKDKTYPGAHDPIIEEPLWDMVQAQLQAAWTCHAFVPLQVLV
jgi:hypothetical protein